MNLATVKDNIKTLGLPKTAADLGLRAANRVLLFKIFKAVAIERVNASFLECDPRYRGLFLDEPMLRGFAKDPKNELSHEFLDAALAKGDQCYGFVDGTELASYGWYSAKPTNTDMPGIVQHFSDRDVYMYKGFTDVNHRGQRLHAVGMTRALESYLGRGYRGIVSTAEWNNFPSLKSGYRMGFHDFGSITVSRLGHRYLLHHDAGCQRYAFEMKQS